MSIATEISRLQTARNTIRDKAVELGIAANTAKLDTLATAIDAIENKGAVSATVQEGDTYTIPKGYHNGSGTVSGVAGGGNYSLQSKTITPTKNQQSVTPDSGFYGLSDVTVAAIPEAYQNVSSVDATAADVLSGKIIVTADGTVTTGTMANNGAATKTLTTSSTSYTIAKGYHNGTGKVSITLETKSVSPTRSIQTITPTTGKVLSSVTIAAIPDTLIDTTDATAAASEILVGKTAYVNTSLVEGTMPNNGIVTKVLDTTTKSYTIAKGFHSGTGTVSIVTETKTVTPTKSSQSITPAEGKVLSSVTVAAIPDNYIDTSDATADATDILSGKTAYINGILVEGTMHDNGMLTLDMDGLTTTVVNIPTGYVLGGSVHLTDDIENALAAI